jgi:hypothetical protein
MLQYEAYPFQEQKVDRSECSRKLGSLIADGGNLAWISNGGPGRIDLEVWLAYVDVPLDRLPAVRLGDDVVTYFCEGTRHGFGLVPFFWIGNSALGN